MMIKGIVFDMDGVLVDNRDTHIEAFGIFCRRHGVALDRAALLPLFGRGNDEILPAILPPQVLASNDITALGIEKEEIYRDLFRERLAPTRGLLPFIDTLRREGFRLAVGSSGPKENVDFVLARCGIADRFDAVVNGGMVTRCKPDPEIYLLAARLLGLPPQECLAIEDAPPGIESARRAGMRIAILATTFPREHFHATPHDLIAGDFTDFPLSELARL